MLGSGDLLIINRYVLHQLGGIDPLSIANANEVMESQSRKGNDRRSIQGGIVKTVEQMNSTWTWGSDAHAELPSLLCKATIRHRRALPSPKVQSFRGLSPMAPSLVGTAPGIAGRKAVTRSFLCLFRMENLLASPSRSDGLFRSRG